MAVAGRSRSGERESHAMPCNGWHDGRRNRQEAKDGGRNSELRWRHRGRARAAGEITVYYDSSCLHGRELLDRDSQQPGKKLTDVVTNLTDGDGFKKHEGNAS